MTKLLFGSFEPTIRGGFSEIHPSMEPTPSSKQLRSLLQRGAYHLEWSNPDLLPPLVEEVVVVAPTVTLSSPPPAIFTPALELEVA